MFVKKLEEANDILDKAVAVLIKEQVVNFEMDVNNFPVDHENDVELLSDLQDIQIWIRLNYKEHFQIL